MRVNQIFQQLGLRNNEIKVYLASLQAGTASAQHIAKIAGLKRTTTYSVLSYLVERGLVGITKERGKNRFVAEPPEKIMDIINHLQREATDMLPQLKALYNQKEQKPKITYFEGDEAIQNVYDDTLREKPDEILEWNTNSYFERFPKNHNYIDKRVALGIKARRMAGAGSVWDTKHQRSDQAELSETAIVPRNAFWPEIEVNIYNNKIAFMNYAENMSVIIESRAIADAMRQVYHLSWIGAKTLTVKE